jgi:hypothetical protein
VIIVTELEAVVFRFDRAVFAACIYTILVIDTLADLPAVFPAGTAFAISFVWTAHDDTPKKLTFTKCHP